MSNEPEFCYVGRAECGCIEAVVSADPRHRERTAKSLSEFILCGLAVDRITVAAFRAAGFGCKCPKAVQEVLFAE